VGVEGEGVARDRGTRGKALQLSKKGGVEQTNDLVAGNRDGTGESSARFQYNLNA